jgi:hypothetical protein
MNLPVQTVQLLKDLASQRNITMTQVVREALALERVVSDYAGKDSKLVIQKNDGEKLEVLLPRG